ncbi:hypothetical protein CEXT_53731 [Caerostris extrusa]|uniref:Uncharacterized protein n=1 Tax=Caerostris extrusa TaxID=172846 RepID=A0AAV4VAI8_CAEEX|nr:hypothetical protein CEXT_53731 [Caerostris extrusa]
MRPVEHGQVVDYASYMKCTTNPALARKQVFLSQCSGLKGLRNLLTSTALLWNRHHLPLVSSSSVTRCSNLFLRSVAE